MPWWTKFTMTQVEQALTNALEGGTPAASLIHQASRTLTNAEILGAGNTGSNVYPTVIPAAGSNKVILIIFGYQEYRLITPYTNVDQDNGIYQNSIHLAYGDNVENATTDLVLQNLGSDSTRPTPFLPLIATDKAFGDLGNVVIQPMGSIEEVDNTPIKWVVYNDVGPIGGGDPSNSIVVCALFHVFDRTQKKFLTTVESGWDEATRTFS